MIRFKFLFISVLLVAGIFRSAEAQIDVKQVAFENDEYDFGTVAFNSGSIHATFIFTNNSDVDFQITNVIASCGCTVPNWPKNPIKPGMKGVITARFDPTNLAGEVDKTIEVMANYNNVMSKILRIKGIITPPSNNSVGTFYPGQYGYLRMSTGVIGFGDVKNTGNYTRTLFIYNDYNRNLKIKDILKTPDYVTCEFDKKELKPGDTARLKITVAGDKIEDLGLVNSEISFGTGDVYFPTKSVKISMEVSQDFSQLKKKDLHRKPTIFMEKTTFDLGEIKEGAKKQMTFTVKNTGKSPLKILKVYSVCSCTVLTNLEGEIQPGESVEVTITFDSIFQNSRVEKEVTIYTNDPSKPKVSIMIYAQIIEN
ncbi:MAG: DUF1573 domain-containing protein [Bacteroidetes bacterium]|nr:DUF1573 domain-containing protein [Bacteroidota bacterium]